MDYQYQAAIIGGGPGGYIAAIRAAQLGLHTVLVEKDQLGGVCLNRGCIPTKTLLNAADKFTALSRLNDFGLWANDVGFDFERIMARKDAVVAKLRDGIAQVLKSWGVTVLPGSGAFHDPHTLRVALPDGATSLVTAAHIIIASGSQAVTVPIPGANLPGVVTSDALLSLTQVPAQLTVIGAGAVGIEFGAIYAAFGTQVTVVEKEDTILPGLDVDVVRRMAPLLRKKGLRLLTGTAVTGITPASTGLAVTVQNKQGAETIPASLVLMAVGRRADTTSLNLAAAGVVATRQGIPVAPNMATNVPHIYAVGDVTGTYMWAHAAAAEGITAAENAAGRQRVMNYQAVPGCVFTSPEIAMVGYTTAEAAAHDMAINAGRFNFAANGKALAMGESGGMVKIIVAKQTDRVLGMHIIGPHASDLIMEGTLSIRYGLTATQLADAIHPHPTLCETVAEAAHGVDGWPLHQAAPGGAGRRV